METFLFILSAIIGWYGFLAVLYWLSVRNCPTSTPCSHCEGRGYTLDMPLVTDKKKYSAYLKCLKRGWLGTPNAAR